MSEQEILFRRDGDTGIVTFNRPRARNALTFAMYQRLAEICTGEAADGGLRTLVLSGAGEHAFAAGTDIGQFSAFRDLDDARAYEQRISEVLDAVENCPVPTIAALHGACTGGGAGIAAACDLRIAAPDLRFGVPIARTLGNCLSVDTLSRLVDLIGAAATRELILTARLLGADEALARGLVSEVVEDAAQLLPRALELARTLAGYAPLTLRATRVALNRMRASQGVEQNDLIALCYGSDDFREGVRAFAEKRPPRWQGR